MKQSSLAKECVNLVQESFIISAPGVVLTTLYGFRYLQMVPIKLSIIFIGLERLASDNHSNLLGPFVSYKKSVVSMTSGA
jgi:hypothetical protein